MHQDQNARLTDAELYALFGRLFPYGFAGADMLAEVAPDGWERSPFLACFHLSVERVFEAGVPTRSAWLAAGVIPSSAYAPVTT